MFWSTGSRHTGFIKQGTGSAVVAHGLRVPGLHSSCSTWTCESLLTGSRAPAQQLWSGGAAPQRMESSWVRDGICVLHCKMDSYLLRPPGKSWIASFKSLGNGTLSNLDDLYRESNSELLPHSLNLCLPNCKICVIISNSVLLCRIKTTFLGEG